MRVVAYIAIYTRLLYVVSDLIIVNAIADDSYGVAEWGIETCDLQDVTGDIGLIGFFEATLESE